MTWKAQRGEGMCIPCINGFHHSAHGGETPHGAECLCVCQEYDFAAWCENIRGHDDSHSTLEAVRGSQSASLPVGA